MRAVAASGGGFWPSLADIRAAVEARGEVTRSEDEDVIEVKAGGGALLPESDHRGLHWWRDPATG